MHDGEHYCQECMKSVCPVCGEYLWQPHLGHCAVCQWAFGESNLDNHIWGPSREDPTVCGNCYKPLCDMLGDGCGHNPLIVGGTFYPEMVASGYFRIDALGNHGTHRQADGRLLCDRHDKSENAEKRKADAEAQRLYDALPKELYCSTCDTVVDPADVDDEPWYYCENSGDEFNRDETESYDHRCPYCNKFASRSETKHCGVCREALENRVIEEVAS
jgi:hypothetical protein